LTRSAALYFAVLSVAVGCGTRDDAAPVPAADPRSGGSTTVYDATKLAYANQAPLLTNEHAERFSLGHAIFNQNWVTAPATTEDMDGLGPRYNQRSCSACHSHDGRSAPFDSAGNQLGILFRLSVPGQDEHGGPLGDSVYGGQLRTHALLGIAADAAPSVSYEERPDHYADGSKFSLQMPSYAIADWQYGPPSAELLLSPRIGSFLFGLGLLEAIPEDAILANVRVGDPDGVVGRPNYVWDVTSGSEALGRFGWKANVPLVLDQISGAFVGDMGITSSLFPDETCTATMTECAAATSGGSPEIDDEKLAAVALYMRTLAVPARRALDDEKTLHGAELFASFGCSSCHVDSFETGEFLEIPELSYQKIHPYTDLLLHDMGEALADGRPDFEASGSDWRTAPLWGIGLLQTVNHHELMLHDGRARGPAEAILWHGGEADASRERFRNASESDRDALLSFLRSL